MNSKLTACIRLVRPLNALMTFASIAAAVVICSRPSLRILPLLLAPITGMLVAGGANAINDYFDIEIDRINRPGRPLPSGALQKRDALGVWAILSVVGISVNLFLNSSALLVALVSAGLLYIYSRFLKRTLLAGNVLVATMTGMAFIYGGVAAGEIRRALIPALFAFLSNLARELVKDVEDTEGDARNKAATLPVAFGADVALRFASVVILLLICATIAAFLAGIYSATFLSVVLVVDLALAFVAVTLWRPPTPRRLRMLSTTLKGAMAGGLLAIYLGS
ncbi:MAG TPA: geranylgeranylglycerol-phosphate geranylgeranyltransferase [Bacteroidota bacterium]|nr:geranylgeranylglycerol-phosphate geranylgeranyltransferase [Bacteroidota bacterium]